MKIRDERLIQQKNKIYAELLMIFYFIAALSFLYKSLVLNYSISQCAMEYIILIFTPIYQALRTRQLGMVLFTEENSLSKKRNLISIAAFVCMFAIAYFFKKDNLESTEWIAYVLSYIAAFIFIRFIFVKIELNRAKKLEEMYDEE